MTAATASRQTRFSPARASWRRLTVFVTLLVLGWALAVPVGHTPRWWHYLVGAALALALVGSWHGQHVSTTMARWTPMVWRNQRLRSRGSGEPVRRRHRTPHSPGPAGSTARLHAQIVVHVRPQPHALITTDDVDDQLPWEFVTAWLDRYGIRTDTLTVCSVTRTPPASGLRSDAATLLGGRRTQHHDTWLTYTVSAHSNVGALVARHGPSTTSTPQAGDTDADADGRATTPGLASLADTTARRLIAELRERGWLATVADQTQLPQFVPASVTVRRHTWTGIEYSDGYRAVYAVDPAALADVAEALPALPTKSTWLSLTVRSQGRQPATISAVVGTLTTTRPARCPLSGLHGFHGLHHQVAPTLTATHFAAHTQLPRGPLAANDLTALRWPTTAAGVPIGFNRARQPVYLGLASPEPVRITVTGTPQFQVGITARLALSGLTLALYTADPARWAALANHAGPQQFTIQPTSVSPEAIVVSDGSCDTPAGAGITVTLRQPQSTQAPATTVVITQDDRHPDLFYITTPHGRQWLSSRLSE